MIYRCMFVALDEASTRACKIVISPLEAIIVPTVPEACKRMSEVLPLIVLLADDAPANEVPELMELAGACGAEVINVKRPVDTSPLGRTILEALRKGEARRVPR
jgi:hypothetical protein